MQPGILDTVPAQGRYVNFDLDLDYIDQLPQALQQLQKLVDGHNVVLGIGHIVLNYMHKTIPGFDHFPLFAQSLVDAPVVPKALWLWLRGDDQGSLVHQAYRFKAALQPVFIPACEEPAFTHDTNRDLSGYIDGTENPKGEEAVQAASIRGVGAGVDGSCFVAVQKWVHNFAKLTSLVAQHKTDDLIGRRMADSEELDDRPDSSHVSRTDQESFSPAAHVFRQSMPWSTGAQSGLMFCAFTADQRAFNVQWQRMIGLEDGIIDGLFQFTTPVSSTYYWCPPYQAGKVDLSFLLGA